MPIFEFACVRCGARIEVIRLSADEADRHSVWCRSIACKPVVPGGVCRMQRVPSVTNFALKGAGFHINDYPKEK